MGLDLRADEERMILPRTGQNLLEEMVRGCLSIKLDQARKDNHLETLPLMAKIWATRLEKWGMLAVFDRLMEYSEMYQGLLARFGTSGDIRKPDGSVYDNPTWSFRWRDLAISMGMSDLRVKIDGEQHKAGLGKANEPSLKKMWSEPIGLADAFALSMRMAKVNTFPAMRQVLGVGEELFVQMPQISISVNADIVTVETTENEAELVYELHWYEIAPPKIGALMNDYRVKALYSALPREHGGMTVGRVIVRHLVSGVTQKLSIRRGAGLSEIVSMATAVHRRLEASDFSGPRMVNGWSACGNCEYKPLCFDGDGLMTQYNPPLSGSVKAARDLLPAIREEIQRFPREDIRAAVELARIVLPWVTRYPGMTKNQIEWLLQSLLAEGI